MGCHSTARTVNPDHFVSSDFSFTLNNSEPKLVSTKLIPPPQEPKTPWDKEHWNKITWGYTLTTETYEKLPQNVPTARLHCSSCHLNAGGNADAAWWVDLKYRYKTKPELQSRVNQCFERSLNGKALFTPSSKGNRGDCEDNHDMEAFLTYIEWLDEQWERKKRTGAPAHTDSCQFRHL